MSGWWHEARCVGRGDYFHAERGTRQRAVPTLIGAEMIAAATCALCPVRTECLSEAIEPTNWFSLVSNDRVRFYPHESETEGIWAGLLPIERKGASIEDVPSLLSFALERAVREGLAPPDLLETA